MDPKCNWALNHLDKYPVEVNKAEYETLLRVPGIGMISANRIVAARRTAKLTFEDLKKLGVVLKRAAYFITCSGKAMYGISFDEKVIYGNLTAASRKEAYKAGDGAAARQLSYFNDVPAAAGLLPPTEPLLLPSMDALPAPMPVREDVQMSITGQM